MGRDGTMWRPLLAAVAMFAVQGCQATGGEDPQRMGDGADRVWDSLHCGVAAADVRVLEDAASVDRIVERARRNRLGGTDLPGPRIEFGTRRAVLVALGEKPTTGYSVAPAADGFVITGERARLTVERMSPPPDSVQAQVTTSPCALITIPRGGYSTLVVQDAEGPDLARIGID